jgi:hypothetical protein
MNAIILDGHQKYPRLIFLINGHGKHILFHKLYKYQSKLNQKNFFVPYAFYLCMSIVLDIQP